LIDNKFVAGSIPWNQADVYGGIYSGKNGHATFWATLQRLLPQWKGKEYTDFLPGRVLCDSMEEDFLVYLFREIVNSPDLKKMIFAEFNLPLTATKSAADFHLNA
jgi:hypothetical protein